MRTIEIPRSNWATFLNEVTRRAAGRAIRLAAEDLQWGDQEMAEDMPLHEISLETKGSDAGVIEITVGGRQDELSHRIERPKRVYALLDDTMAVQSLAIEDGEGGKALLSFEELLTLPAFQRNEAEHAPGP